MKKTNLLRDFGIGLSLAAASWGCWAFRTQCLVESCWWGVGLLAGIEEAITLGSVVWVVGVRTWAGALGCCIGAALGAGLVVLLS